jgi:hypothetical protein
MTSTTAERQVRATVTIRQRWRRRADGAVFTVHQVHRAERTVELRREERLTVRFSELASAFIEVSR